MAGNTTYKNGWAKEKLDRISLTLPKGQKAELQSHAKQHGKSLNAFIKRAIQEAVERDRLSDAQKDKISANATSHDRPNEDQEELKKSVSAFDALKPVMPDRKSVDSSKLPHSKKRQQEIFVAPITFDHSK